MKVERLWSQVRPSWITLAIIGGAFVAGITGSIALTPSNAAATDACESDECENTCHWGICNEECKDNPGQSTACSIGSGEDGCTTTGCS